MDHLVQVLQIGTTEQIANELVSFFTKYGNVTVLNESISSKSVLLNELFKVIRDSSKVSLYALALQVIRILTRDAQVADTIFNADRIETLLHLANLVGEEEAFMTENSTSFDAKIVVEAQKCLSNLISISNTVRRICCSNSSVEGIMLRLRMHPDPKLPHEVKYFDMLMLFLLTALCSELRSKVCVEFHGLIYLMESIDLILKNNAEYLAENMPNKNKRRSKGSRRGRKTLSSSNDNKEDASDDKIDESLVAYCLEDWEVNLSIQVLKVLFNLTINIDSSKMKEFEEGNYLRLVSILHDLLLCETKNANKKEDLQSSIVNLLTNMPEVTYEELLSKIAELGKPENPDHEYDEMNMEVIAVLLKFLNNRLDNASPGDLDKSLCPILICLIKAARSHTIIRKYMRYHILPPLKDVSTRPEQGNTMRNKLVRMMTSPTSKANFLCAHFLFILCKKSVNRLIKYTGYGNAAGLLASEGLLGIQPTRPSYSSDSEDSETDEYVQNIDKIDPMTGCLQDHEPRDPFEGMSEEQKEYEALRLVNAMDKMQRTGIIQPCRIGKDGQPQPIQHVLELQNAHANEKPN